MKKFSLLAFLSLVLILSVCCSSSFGSSQSNKEKTETTLSVNVDGKPTKRVATNTPTMQAVPETNGYKAKTPSPTPTLPDAETVLVCPPSPNFQTEVPFPREFKTAKAFPGAVGFGTETAGGRGGRVIYVTNLNDSGEGSLRAALTAREPRMVLFAVSGTIRLKEDIIITYPFLTVAGQTAPGEGVQVRDAQIKISTHDVIIRYLKVRSGDSGNTDEMADRDAITVNNGTQAYNVVIDHSTLMWGPDIGGLTFLNGAHDSTVSYSIIGEGLYLSRHPEGVIELSGHSMGMNITELSSDSHPIRITVHHNLLTTSSDRNPRIIGGENIDVVNNVIYNWQHAASQGNPRSVNLINNYYIRGPMTTHPQGMVGWFPKIEIGGSLRANSVYESGNIGEGLLSIRGGPRFVYASELFHPYSFPDEDPPEVAYKKIVDDVGADTQVSGAGGRLTFVRDNVDRQIIENLVNRSGTFLNGRNQDGEAGFASITWPELASGEPAQDLDKDGMPDAWERRFFCSTERGSKNDSSSDYDGDGYTDLEEYLNRTNPTR